MSALPPFIAERLLHLVALLPTRTTAVETTEPQKEDVREVETKAREPKPSAVRQATGKRAAIIEFYNADAQNRAQTSSAAVAEAIGAASSYVRRLCRELDAIKVVSAL